MPQTAQELWIWLSGLLPLTFRPYAGLLAATLGALAAVAAIAGPLIDLWRTLRWNNPGKPSAKAAAT